MLYLVATWPYGNTTLKAVEVLKKCEKVYAENYTNPLESLDFIKEELGIKYEKVGRRFLEEDMGKLVQDAKSKNIALCTIGDPLSATTHSAIISECNSKGVKWQVIPGPSALWTAMTQSGLSPYKFGPVCTIASWSKNYQPTTTLELLEKNLSFGLHSLLLLDITQDEKPQTLFQALDTIRLMQKKLGRQVITQETKIVVLSRLLTPRQKISFVKLGEIDKLEGHLPPHCIVVPSSVRHGENPGFSSD